MDFEKLLIANKATFANNADKPGMQSVSLLLTNGKIHSFYADAGDGVDRISSAIAQALPADATVEALVCQWAGSEHADLPHIGVRQTLLALNAANENTQILLWGQQGFNVRLLKDTF